MIVAVPPEADRTVTGPDGAAAIFWASVDGLTLPESSTTPEGGGAVAQVEVEVTSCACAERLPAASYATTANVYDVPHVRPD